MRIWRWVQVGVCGIGIAAAALISVDARAQDIMGVAVEPMTGEFVATADANVRDGPNGKRVSGINQGDRVEAVGKSIDQGWIAIRQDENLLGFISPTLLMAVVDGVLAEPLKGKIAIRDVACDFEVELEGRVEVAGESFATVDYAVEFNCTRDKILGQQQTHFFAVMFLTEAPFNLSRTGPHQLSLDIRKLGNGFDQGLTLDMMYHPQKNELVFEEGSDSAYLASTPPARPAKDVADALQGGLEMALGALNDAAWTRLFEKES